MRFGRALAALVGTLTGILAISATHAQAPALVYGGGPVIAQTRVYDFAWAGTMAGEGEAGEFAAAPYFLDNAGVLGVHPGSYLGASGGSYSLNPTPLSYLQAVADSFAGFQGANILVFELPPGTVVQAGNPPITMPQAAHSWGPQTRQAFFYTTDPPGGTTWQFTYSHELVETATDPYGNAWTASNGQEAADVCAPQAQWLPDGTFAALYDSFVNGQWECVP